jgi:hypothetical protein
VPADRIFSINAAGHITAPATVIECHTDEQAVAEARALCLGHDRSRSLAAGGARFDHLLGNSNLAPQGFQVQACLPPDGLCPCAVISVLPTRSTAAFKPVRRLRSMTQPQDDTPPVEI